MPYPDEALFDFERIQELKEIICETPSDELPPEIHDLYATYFRSCANHLSQAMMFLRAGDQESSLPADRRVR